MVWLELTLHIDLGGFRGSPDVGDHGEWPDGVGHSGASGWKYFSI